MKYINAEEILPIDLLEKIQTYIDGKYLYIPTRGKRKSWGENSGIKGELKKRNMAIKDKYHQGYSIAKLAIEYYLSESSIRKIISKS
ncbi:Mor family transcriptional regulator [Clostridium tetanomorphum]|uniref:DNA-binding response regulator n=1 Tax=Clostridium tetanomorphum TaxID=1553 RepID=A0A923J2T4_CLOTT|nr:CD3324 family protein [Clostridium tetanomorphum]KAJ51695.1 hypothetical protein CTM_11350 [Clostridium tetanomorphum DSM 665]MBC2399130.1 DNA-binding response regulator [Clostridium tetanomorphum]MBP1865942.1 Mor family transcriptional regulator [Clostridium tetanomorphum]NRS86123.1 Mor family transcriptional regulator [Clostridium tetanomorphum]NRZ95856.1 Mor family transcriptional regulator [Clostridium tetanomorphum]